MHHGYRPTAIFAAIAMLATGRSGLHLPASGTMRPIPGTNLDDPKGGHPGRVGKRAKRRRAGRRNLGGGMTRRERREILDALDERWARIHAELNGA